MRLRQTLVVASLAVAVLAACGSGDRASSGAQDGGTLRVFAAASLADSFSTLAEEFERQHDGVEVELVLGGSADLVAQIQQGAPADVFASADTANMDKLTAEGLEADPPQDFATNTLEIATPAGNPAGITTFADLARPGLAVVVCAPEVPCGAATVRAQEATGVTLEPVSEEQAVTDVLGKVTSGEADAGLVYVTDVRAAGDDVTGVPFPEAADIVNTYPIAALGGARDVDLAREFVALVLSGAGREVLAAQGFGTP